jgi:hypothetical protein
MPEVPGFEIEPGNRFGDVESAGEAIHEWTLEELLDDTRVFLVGVRHPEFSDDKPSPTDPDYADRVQYAGRLTVEGAKTAYEQGREIAANLAQFDRGLEVYGLSSPTEWVNEAEGLVYEGNNRTLDTLAFVSLGMMDYANQNNLEIEFHSWEKPAQEDVEDGITDKMRLVKYIRDAGYDSIIDLDGIPQESPTVAVAKNLAKQRIADQGLDGVKPGPIAKDIWVEGHSELDESIHEQRQQGARDPRTSTETAATTNLGKNIVSRSISVAAKRAVQEQDPIAIRDFTEKTKVVLATTHGLVMRADALHNHGEEDIDIGRPVYYAMDPEPILDGEKAEWDLYQPEERAD